MNENWDHTNNSEFKIRVFDYSILFRYLASHYSELATHFLLFIRTNLLFQLYAHYGSAERYLFAPISCLNCVLITAPPDAFPI